MVDNPIHPLNGQELVVRYETRFAGVATIVAEHPAGGTISLPEAQVFGPAVRPASLIGRSSVLALLEKVDFLSGRGRS